MSLELEQQQAPLVLCTLVEGKLTSVQGAEEEEGGSVSVGRRGRGSTRTRPTEERRRGECSCAAAAGGLGELGEGRPAIAASQASDHIELQGGKCMAVCKTFNEQTLPAGGPQPCTGKQRQEAFKRYSKSPSMSFKAHNPQLLPCRMSANGRKLLEGYLAAIYVPCYANGGIPERGFSMELSVFPNCNAKQPSQSTLHNGFKQL